MGKEIKHKLLTEQDIKIIQSDPAGLADYIVRSKVRDFRKTSIVVAIVLAVFAFLGGFAVGITWAKVSMPNNLVQIHVGDTESVPEITTEHVEK